MSPQLLKLFLIDHPPKGFQFGHVVYCSNQSIGYRFRGSELIGWHESGLQPTEGCNFANSGSNSVLNV